MKTRRLALIALSLTLVAVACTPAPRRNLTAAEKLADLHWVYSLFGDNYAPLDYKAQNAGFDWETLKAETDAAAVATKTNEEFYWLAWSFLAKFKDAHTVMSVAPSGLPGRETMSYLGFTGVRKGDRLLVTEILPTTETGSLYPIKKNDQILEMDGESLTVHAERFKRYADLGNDESNLTYHMPRLFSRLSIENGIPESENATLKIKRGSKTFDVVIPWVKKDLHQYRLDMAHTETPAADNDDDRAVLKQIPDRIQALTQGGDLKYLLGFLDFNGAPVSPSLIGRRLLRGPGHDFWNSFIFVRQASRWTTLPKTAEDRAEEAKPFGGVRNVPDHAVFLSEAKTYKTYVVNAQTVAGEEEEDKDRARDAAPKLVAYTFLDTFAPSDAEDKVVKEFKATLATLQDLGVKDLVIDMVNNGGGSLLLGMRLAQALSDKPVQMPEMRFALNEGWLDDFEQKSLNADSDAEKELYRRVFVKLLAQKQQGKRLSDPLPSESIQPFLLTPNTDVKKPLRVILLVNEMCASMCDIFSAILQDNGLAEVMGTRTMGAGGNVVMHLESPNAHFALNQTESLILRKDGTPLENHGVTPDVDVPVSTGVAEKYTPLRDRAFKRLLGDEGGRANLQFLPSPGTN